MVFYCSFGGLQDQADFGNRHYDRGKAVILVHEGVLYNIGDSISAWNVASSEKIWRHFLVFSDIPETKRVISDCLQPVYHGGKIYFTNQTSYSPDSFRNIHCIDAATGKLVWNTIAVDSVSLQTNPIITNGKLFIVQHHGFWVYNPKNGKLIGVDKKICGTDVVRNLLYDDILITLKQEEGKAKFLAVYVGK